MIVGLAASFSLNWHNTEEETEDVDVFETGENTVRGWGIASNFIIAIIINFTHFKTMVWIKYKITVK